MVISAVNFTEGGPLEILKGFVTAACDMLPQEWQIVVFVYDRMLLDLKRPRVIELRRPKTSWLRRMHLEWLGFRAYARELHPDLWVSLHDVTPRIGAVRQAVYCHNPMPFYRLRLRDVWLEPKSLLFRYFYAVVYRINIRHNYAIVVQQSWLRDKFRKWVEEDTRIIVSHPTGEAQTTGAVQRQKSGRQFLTFIYPTLPRVFKNAELICDAVHDLEQSGDWRGQVVLTIDGSENRYGRWLARRYKDLKRVRFAGRQSPQQMKALYEAADCLIFPSLLETWGLPITEVKRLGMPMLVADLPYAHETVGDYDKVSFIDAHDHRDLTQKLLAIQRGDAVFGRSGAVTPAQPFASNWTRLLHLLTEGIK